MTDTIKQEDLIEKVLPSETEEVEADKKAETEQDPLKVELDRVQKKEGRTQKEKLLFTKNRVEQQLREIEGDEPEKVVTDDADDNAPLTVGMFKKMQQENATKTAIQLSEDIEDETERELTQYHLNNSIKSTGNPTEDLKLARTLTNAAKNKQIIEEVERKIPAKTHSNGSSAPGKDEKIPELTAEELSFTRPPWNMSVAEIVKTRTKS